MDKQDEWASERIHIYIWHCNDEECDCWQPVIEKILPNHDVGYPWILRHRKWEGSFYSQPDTAERLKMQQELKEEAASYGIELNTTLSYLGPWRDKLPA